MAPSLQLVEGAFTVLIVILNQDQDESVTNLFSAIFSGLIITSCANMLVYTVIAPRSISLFSDSAALPQLLRLLRCGSRVEWTSYGTSPAGLKIEMAPAVIGINTRALRGADPEPPLAPGVARIYSHRFCPFAERVTLYAAAKGIPVEVVNIHLQDKPLWYFNKHPEGKVPAFEKDGKIVIESDIIPEYLDGICPESAILPFDPYEKAMQRLKLEKLRGLPPVLYRLLPVLKDPENVALREETAKALEAALDTAEATLDGEYFGGSAPGFADWMSLPFFERFFIRADNFPSISISSFPGSRWPRLSAWFPRVYTHPATKAVAQSKEIHDQFNATGASFYTQNPDVGL